jgi:glutathione S-transferase
MGDGRVVPLRQLERMVFRAWCEWLCRPWAGRAEAGARAEFQRTALAMESALEARGGPFFLGGELTTADLVFVPYVERMNASLAYYKGFLLRREHPSIHRWLAALEERSTYLGTQSDFHTHAHDLPPQMGGCYASGEPAQRALAARIDAGPWPIGAPMGEGADRGGEDPWPGEALLDPETTQRQPVDAARIALARVLKHRAPILARNPLPPERFEPALRCALTALVAGTGEEGRGAGGNGLAPMPPPGSAPGLRYLRDRISVPRDMPLHAARLLRQALEATARQDPADPRAQSLPIPLGHRRDQDPLPFLAPLHSRAS